ncbi:hypothetical protein DPMN_096795 [Dreissena polymorpha]|uniref:Uncharacterized protein n=1 Tax=Dreissena polymorpha TaxID=45954 RepID=A0A9D4L926_DREPO|nr:hypothetical protein DPMN_096795 [Dreissena polymorpha]
MSQNRLANLDRLSNIKSADRMNENVTYQTYPAADLHPQQLFDEHMEVQSSDLVFGLNALDQHCRISHGEQQTAQPRVDNQLPIPQGSKPSNNFSEGNDCLSTQNNTIVQSQPYAQSNAAPDLSLSGTQLNRHHATVCNAHKVPTEYPSLESTFRKQTTKPSMPPNAQLAAQHTRELPVPQNACSDLSSSHNEELPVTQTPATPQVHLSESILGLQIQFSYLKTQINTVRIIIMLCHRFLKLHSCQVTINLHALQNVIFLINRLCVITQ